MPRFRYTAKSQPDQLVRGVIEADAQNEAIIKLSRMGYFPVSVIAEDITEENLRILYFRKVSRKDIALFTRQLSSLIDSGINIVNALNTLKNQLPNKHLKFVLTEVIGKIKEGRSFSDSLSSYPYLFSQFYSASIRSGEASGKLNEVLKNLADFLEKEEEFRSSLRNSMMYPSFVFAVGTLTIFVLLTFVVPRLVTMFEDMGQFLPLPTRMLIGMANFMHDYWWLILAITIATIFLFNRIINLPQGRISWDRFKLKAAIFGQVNFKAESARLARTVSLLLSSGIPITSSLEIASSILQNEVIKSEIIKCKEQINSGLSLSQALNRSNLFPEFIISIVAIGEETGALEKSFMRIAQDYENQVDNSLKTLARLAEPIIILVLGLVIGFIVLAMLLPIFQINLIVK